VNRDQIVCFYLTSNSPYSGSMAFSTPEHSLKRLNRRPLRAAVWRLGGQPDRAKVALVPRWRTALRHPARLRRRDDASRRLSGAAAMPRTRGIADDRIRQRGRSRPQRPPHPRAISRQRTGGEITGSALERLMRGRFAPRPPPFYRRWALLRPRALFFSFAASVAWSGRTIFFGSTTRSNSASPTKPSFSAASFSVKS